MLGEKLSISYHIELYSKANIVSAHEIANMLEQRIKQEISNISTIISHLEPEPERAETGYIKQPASLLEEKIIRISQSIPEVHSLHEIEILNYNERFNVTLHCVVDSSMNLTQAHEIATKIEENIRLIDKRINQISIHCEPQESA